MKTAAPNKDLLSFHWACHPEFLAILDSFNLLFYGYGCKNKLLGQMFPQAKKFNMKFTTVKDIVEDLLFEGLHDKDTTSLKDIDESLRNAGKSVTLILFNFKFSDTVFKDLKAIRIIATIENIDFGFETKDLLEFNFILRDLTTFENYTEELIDIDLTSSAADNAFSIHRNLSNRSKLLFIELLKLGNCTIGQIFDGVKKTLMITKQSAVIDLLHEFIDHNIIKIAENSIKINLKKDEIAQVLRLCTEAQ